jgi:hypothetical protein
MNRQKILLATILALIAVLIVGTVSVAAKSTKTDFASEESLAPIGAPGRVWESDGIQHIRDFPVAGPVWGELNGRLTVVANINWDLATGDGTAYGTAVLEVNDWNGLTGAFEGRSQWKYTGFAVTDGQFVGHGTGDFAGMHVKANFYDIDEDTTALVGTIHNPHGE